MANSTTWTIDKFYKFFGGVMAVLVLALIFCLSMAVRAEFMNDHPAYDVVCWDAMGNNNIITQADKGTMKVDDGAMYFEVDGTQRIVTGSCIAVEK